MHLFGEIEEDKVTYIQPINDQGQWREAIEQSGENKMLFIKVYERGENADEFGHLEEEELKSAEAPFSDLMKYKQIVLAKAPSKSKTQVQPEIQISEIDEE